MRPGAGRRRRLAALALLVLVAALGCGAEKTARPPDLILISIDTLRADRLGCYGHPLPTSPEIDRLRAGAVLFREAIAQAPSTLASHASMLTSVPPVRLGASFARRRALPESAVTVAEVLQAAGYRTMALTAAGQLAREFGIGQGFEVYRPRSERQQAGAFWPRVGAALSLLEAPDPRPVFLFLHTYEVHHPYRPDPATLAKFDPGYRGGLGERIPVGLIEGINRGEIAIDAADLRHIERAYEAEIVSVDRAVGRLLDWLAASERFRDAVVVVTSDHGEEFGEHGKVGWHSHTLYDELLRVPLLIRLPGGEAAGGEVTLPVRLLDLAPTLLELAGVEAPPEFEGRSLLPLVRGTATRELAALASLDDGSDASHALRLGGWKLWDGRLFDLASDPGERIDRAPDHPARVAVLQRMLAAEIARRFAGEAPTAELDAAAERELRALGYL